MGRVALVGVVALLAAAQQPPEVAVGSRPYTPHVTTLHAQSNLVEVMAVVRDRTGRAVSGMKQSDFRILDRGQERAITTFTVEGEASAAVSEPAAAPPASAAPGAGPLPASTAAAPPQYTALFMDDSSMSSIDLGMARRAVEKFLAGGEQANQHMGLFTASGSGQMDFTSDRARLEQAVRQLTPRTRMPVTGVSVAGISPYLAYSVGEHHSSQAPDTQIAIGHESRAGLCQTRDSCYEAALADSERTLDLAEAVSTDTLAAVRRTVAVLAKMPGQRTLLLTSSGFLTDTLKARQDALAEDAMRAGVVIDTLDAKLLETEPMGISPLEMSLNFATRVDLDNVLATLADVTGGQFFHDNNDMAGALRRMTTERETRYLLGFSPAEMPADGAFHPLQVKLTIAKHMDVQYRKGYFDPPVASDPFAGVPTAALDDLVLSAKGGHDVAAGVTTTVAGHELRVQVTADTEKLPFTRQEGRARESLLFLSAVFDNQNQFVTGKEGVMVLALTKASRERFAKEGLRANLTLSLAPGTYRLREVIREGNQGKFTTLDQPVTVP